MTGSEKKDKILASALELFTSQGIDHTSTAQISKNAGVGTGTLFLYFKSKKELINTLYLEIKKRLKNSVCDTPPDKPFKEIFGMIFRGIIRWALDNPVEYKFIRQFANSPYITSLSKEVIEEEFKDFRIFIEGGIKAKDLRNVPVDMILSVVEGGFHSATEYFLNHDFSDTDLELFFEMYWNAVKRRVK